MFINAVDTCQMIGPCIFTNYTLDIGYLIFVTGLRSERKLHLVR